MEDRDRRTHDPSLGDVVEDHATCATQDAPDSDECIDVSIEKVASGATFLDPVDVSTEVVFGDVACEAPARVMKEMQVDPEHRAEPRDDTLLWCCCCCCCIVIIVFVPYLISCVIVGACPGLSQ